MGGQRILSSSVSADFNIILHLPGFIEVAQDKCVHSDLLLSKTAMLVHQARLYWSLFQILIFNSDDKNVLHDLILSKKNFTF